MFAFKKKSCCFFSCQPIKSKLAPLLSKVDKWQSSALRGMYLASFSYFKFILDLYFLRSREPQLIKTVFIQSFSKHSSPPLYFFLTGIPAVPFSLIWTVFLSIFQIYFLVNYTKPLDWEHVDFVWCVCVRIHSFIPFLIKKNIFTCLEETCFYVLIS